MGDDDVYDITAIANLKKNEVDDESNVVCLVKIPNTNYEKKATVLYDGMEIFLLIPLTLFCFLRNLIR